MARTFEIGEGSKRCVPGLVRGVSRVAWARGAGPQYDRYIMGFVHHLGDLQHSPEPRGAQSSLEAALDYAARGWSVVPLFPPSDEHNGKTPALESWKMLQEEIATLETIRSWFDEGVQRNVGIVTGSVSKLVVVDIDPQKGGRAWLEEKALDSSHKVQTGGDGLHLYFHYEGEPLRSRVRLAAGVDIRAEGGLVVAPPSLHKSGNWYSWLKYAKADPTPLPDWLRNEIKTRSRDQSGIDRVVNGVEEGERNDSATSLVGWLIGQHPAKDWERLWPLIKAWNQQNRPPLDPEELRHVFDSITERERRQRCGVFGQPVSAKDLLSHSTPSPSSIVDGLIFPGVVHLLGGAEGIGKSYLVLQLAEAVASGKPFLGWRVPVPRKVLLLTQELPLNVTSNRLRSLTSNVPDGLYFDQLPGLNVLTDSDQKVLEDRITQLEPQVVIIDTLARVHHGDENQASVAAQVIAVFEKLAVRHEVAVMLVHHLRKPQEPKGKGSERWVRSLADVRGSNVWIAHSQVVAVLSQKPRETGTYMIVFKHNLLRTPPPKTVKRRADGFFETGALNQLVNNTQIAAVIEGLPEPVSEQQLAKLLAEGFGGTIDGMRKRLSRMRGNGTLEESRHYSREGDQVAYGGRKLRESVDAE